MEHKRLQEVVQLCIPAIMHPGNGADFLPKNKSDQFAVYRNNTSKYKIKK
jgi:hypothetical protein